MVQKIQEVFGNLAKNSHYLDLKELDIWHHNGIIKEDLS
jgi:hypothetical protein